MSGKLWLWMARLLDVCWCLHHKGLFPGDSVVKNSPANAGDTSWIPSLGRYPGEGNGNPLQYSCLKNPTDRRIWQATVMESQRVRYNLVTEQQQQQRDKGQHTPCRSTQSCRPTANRESKSSQKISASNDTAVLTLQHIKHAALANSNLE